MPLTNIRQNAEILILPLLQLGFIRAYASYF